MAMIPIDPTTYISQLPSCEAKYVNPDQPPRVLDKNMIENHMRAKTILTLTDTIPPDATYRVSMKTLQAFRPERLVVSPHSFPLSLVRRVWTWPLIMVGSVLGRVHRNLAKLLRVDLLASHEHREYVSDEYARLHIDELHWDSNGDANRLFILVPIPLNRRERLLALLGRVSDLLSQLRSRWQQAQLATLGVRKITIAEQSQFAVYPVDMSAFCAFKDFDASSCMAGQEFEVNVHNGNRRECRLMVALIGELS